MFVSGETYQNVQSGSKAIAIEESKEYPSHYTMFDIEGKSWFELESNDWNNWLLVDDKT